MKNISTKLILIVCCLLLLSCKKYYQEGPTLSLRTKKARVVNKWKIDKMYCHSGNIPGVKIGANKEIPFSDLDSSAIIDLKKDQTVNFKNFRFFYYTQSSGLNIFVADFYNGPGRWEFAEGAFGDYQIEDYLLKKEGIKLSLDNGFGYTSKILKLTENEMWIIGYWPRTYYNTSMPLIELRLISAK